MKLDKIYRIVANEVDNTMPSEEVMNITKEIKETYPEDKEEVLEALECMEEDYDEEEECEMDENDEEGYRQDPDFKGLCEEQE